MPFSKFKISQLSNYSAYIAVTIVHLIILSLALVHFKNNEQPVLSFTINMVDLKSAGNVVANAASRANNSQAHAAQKKTEENKSDLAADKKTVKADAEEKINNKTRNPKTFDSKSRTAVLDATPAVYDAAYLNNAAPNYPPLSRRLKEQGLVMLTVYVNASGRAEQVTIKKSSGFSRLDSAAIEAVKNWRFAAAKQGDQLVASYVQVPINFILE
jgi:TonB family protein